MALGRVKSGILASFHYKTNLFSIESEIVEALSLRGNTKANCSLQINLPTSMSQLHRSELEKAWHRGVPGQGSALSLPMYPSRVWLSSPEVTFPLLFEEQEGLTQGNHEWQHGPHEDT